MWRRTARVCLLVLAVPAFGQDPLPGSVRGGEKVAAIVQRISQAQAGTETLQARFEQRRTTRLLAEPSLSRGRFYFNAPDQVRWEYELPQQMSVLLTGGVALTYRPAEKRAERIEVGRRQRKVFRFLGAAEPLEELKRYFAFTLRDRGDDSNFLLTLDPASHLVKKHVKKVEVEIDRTRFIPVKVVYIEPDGDSTEYVFSDIVRNEPLPAGLFQLDLPPDVQVVEMKLKSRDE
jgi:outer membrane lipoprotein carrier protein